MVSHELDPLPIYFFTFPKNGASLIRTNTAQITNITFESFISLD